ncbi:MAG: 50S ribosomal protein L29 [Flavobacteriales bacterium]
MKISEIRELSKEDIAIKLAEAKAKYQNTQLVHNVSPLENPIQLRKDRKVIARLATELHSRDLKKS